jgi:hypothetical protein
MNADGDIPKRSATGAMKHPAGNELRELLSRRSSTQKVWSHKTPSFRAARKAVQEFKKELKREPLQIEFKLGHLVAGWLAFIGLWEMMRWW